MIRIGVIGPSRRRNGTGPFLARFFHELGAAVTAVSASTSDSSACAASELRSVLGAPVASFRTPEEMVEKGELEALVVCSPMEYHEKHLEIALEAGLHTFCEKPLLCSSRETKGTDSLAQQAARLGRSFAERGLVLHQNTQWTFVWDDIRELLGERALRELQSFAMILAPANPGDSMFWEAVPHPVSMIVALGAFGSPRAIRVELSRDFSSLEIRFEVSCRTADLLHVGIALRAHAEQPRPCRLLLDGVRLDREVISLSPYGLGLRHGPYLHSIVDPVRRAANRFLASIRSRTPEGGDALVRQFQMLEALWAATLTAANVNQENVQPVYGFGW